MATVTYLGESYECTTALQGTDYIHLLDKNGDMIAAFDGVSDLDAFEITGGEWVTPADANDCYLAVFREDGRVEKSNRKVCDVASVFHIADMLYADRWSSEAPYSQTISNAFFNETDVPIMDYRFYEGVADPVKELEQYAYIDRIVAGDGTLTAYCYTNKPTVAIPLQFLVVR